MSLEQAFPAPASRADRGGRGVVVVGLRLAGLRLAGLWLAGLWLAGCAPGSPPELVDGITEDGLTNENWAEADTHQLGTHRVSVASAAREADLRRVAFETAEGDQVTLTGQAHDRGEALYYESVFKTGRHAGRRAWVPSFFLEPSQLEICHSDASLRGPALSIIGTVSRGTRVRVASPRIRNTGTHRYFDVEGADPATPSERWRGFVATGLLCPTADGTPAARVLQLHQRGAITLWNETFGRDDGADPLSNIRDAAGGHPALTSCYRSTPCTEVELAPRLLQAMLDLHVRYGQTYFVSSIAGAEHGRHSFHYVGRAFDVAEIEGAAIWGPTPATRRFLDACRELGAIEALGPSNDPDHHYDHIHCAW